MEDTDIDARARVLVKDLAAWALGLSSRTSRISDLLAASQAVEVLLRNGYSLACLGEDDIAKIDSTIEKYVTESEAFFDFGRRCCLLVQKRLFRTRATADTSRISIHK